MIKPVILNKKELLRRITDKIDAQYHPQKIILFGSYAWGNPAKDSDIDLLIVKETNERRMAFAQLTYRESLRDFSQGMLRLPYVS